MQQLKKTLSNHLVNLSGWTTSKKIVVFESDDWGSLRMPSLVAFDSLLKSGIPVDKSPYCLYDNLCTSQDVTALFEVLQNHQDAEGNHPRITANAVVANPDFEKIKAANFETYSYETIATTFERFFPNENPFPLWNQGMKENLFFPQFHGREHVNVPFWLETLRNNDPIFTKAFQQGCWGISNDVYHKYSKSIQGSFDYNYKSDLEFMKDSIVDGLNVFEQLFGFRSESFVPNNYIWPSELNETLVENGVRYMQGMKYQLLPKPVGETTRKKTKRFNGQKVGANPGILQTVRNAQFEPSLKGKADRTSSVKDCLDQIQTAFFWKKPAVISIHRINFCGALQEENRTLNLQLFNQLLHEIVKRWPDVVFLDSVSLAKNIH